MENLQIENMNSQISYADGKIKWESGKGYTSETMKYLYQCGYTASTSGIMHYLNDSEGNRIAQAYSWEGLLLETAKIMA
jgi:hypothetical protein